MPNQLSLSARPRSFEGLIGQKKVIAAVRGHMKTGRMVKAWMFTGPRGCGKTSISRIMALSLQCTHQDEFGRPCKACYKARSTFPIYELNASKVKDISDALSGVEYGVMGAGRYRVYILDEVQRFTDAAQNLLLKLLEDTPPTTIFILCTTAPQKVLETVRRRCAVYEMRELEVDDIPVLVEKLLRTAASELPADRLCEALLERGVRAPALIAQAVEKYTAGLAPEEAVEVEGTTEVNIKGLTRSLVRGQWPEVAKYLMEAEGSTIKAIRISVIAYLRVVLLESPEIGDRTKAIAKAVAGLCNVSPNAEDSVVAAALAAELYMLSEIFAGYRL